MDTVPVDLVDGEARACWRGVAGDLIRLHGCGALTASTLLLLTKLLQGLLLLLFALTLLGLSRVEGLGVQHWCGEEASCYQCLNKTHGFVNKVVAFEFHYVVSYCVVRVE